MATAAAMAPADIVIIIAEAHRPSVCENFIKIPLIFDGWPPHREDAVDPLLQLTVANKGRYRKHIF
jgi:hypothetical protein